MKLSKLAYVAIPVSIILFGLLIYPTLYKYDKLEQKYPVKINRLTGEAQILTSSGWIKSSDSKIYEDKMLVYKNEIQELISNQNSAISNKVSTELSATLKKQILGDVTEQLSLVEEEITAYKNFKTNPDNRFTVGASKDVVKSIMGTPDDISNVGPYDTWSYGRATVNFFNGKVNGWSDSNDILMIK